MKKFFTFMSGNNRIVALVLIAVSTLVDAIFGVDLGDYVRPILNAVGFDGVIETASGNSYTSAQIAASVYGAYAIGLTLFKRVAGKPENPSIDEPEMEASGR